MIEGIAALGLSIYWLLRYVHLEKNSGPEPALHPSGKEIIQLLQIADLVNTKINLKAQNDKLQKHSSCH